MNRDFFGGIWWRGVGEGGTYSSSMLWDLSVSAFLERWRSAKYEYGDTDAGELVRRVRRSETMEQRLEVGTARRIVPQSRYAVIFPPDMVLLGRLLGLLM